MLPRMAMPSAPPTSRVVSLTAEPTPAFSCGTPLMMLAVAGAAGGGTAPPGSTTGAAGRRGRGVRVVGGGLRPGPSSTRATGRTRYGVLGLRVARTPKPAATNTKPAAIPRPLPDLAAIAALRGATATRARARGSVARPALNGE